MRGISGSQQRGLEEQVVDSLPDAGLFLHICLSHALKSASDGPSWYQSANIRVDSHYNVAFSHLLAPQNKQTAWVKECVLSHMCQKSLTHSFARFPWSYRSRKLCSAWTHTALFSHLLHSLAMLEEMYSSSPSLFLSFCWAFYLTGSVKWRHCQSGATLHALFDSGRRLYHSVKVV